MAYRIVIEMNDSLEYVSHRLEKDGEVIPIGEDLDLEKIADVISSVEGSVLYGVDLNCEEVKKGLTLDLAAGGKIVTMKVCYQTDPDHE